MNRTEWETLFDSGPDQKARPMRNSTANWVTVAFIAGLALLSFGFVAWVLS